MIIDDNTIRHGFANRVRIPEIKGHIKITLHNCKNGKNEVIEGDNIVTNAVGDILANNYCGAVDYSKIFGSDGLWKKWFGGVLLYQNPHPTITVDNEQVLDPTNYYPQADSVNHLVAHAGQTTIDANHDDDLRRGNPTTAAYAFSEHEVKYVYEWGTTHGNGTISALSLTHSDTGDAGLGSNTYAFQNFEPFDLINIDGFSQVATTGKCFISDETLFGQYDDDNNGFLFKIGSDGQYTDNNIFFSTNEVTVYIKHFPFGKVGLFERWSVNNDYVRKFKITSSNITFYTNPCYYFDYTNKLLYLFSNMTSTAQAYSMDHINYIVIDCENEVETAHGTIISDTANIACLGYVNTNEGYNWKYRANTNAIIKSGNYFFFPTATAAGLSVNGYKKINFNNQSDQTTITFNTAQNFYTQPAYCGDLLVSYGGVWQEMGSVNGIVVNGTTGYNCKNTALTGQSYSMAYGNTYRPSFFGMGVGGNSNLAYTNRFVLANKMVNTTLFNLPSPIQKSGSQAMTVEYTLTEVSE